jgi:subtilase family serine protease
LDVEWAHAIAPGANILLVETASDQLTDLLAGVDYARHQPGVSVVSMSWGSSEFSQETTLDSYFTTPAGHAGVTFLAATGDGGAPANWPAVSPNVVAVGGTALLTFDATGTYRYETGWSCSGGGVSLFESAPAYQRGAVANFGRSAPDVAWDADPMTGFAIYTTTTDSGPPGWTVMGGTSAATPQWAALVAIANQGRAVRGAAPLQSMPAALYQLPSSDFHVVASGSNGLPCGPGYNMVTGLGTPYANRAVQGLVASTSAATPVSPIGSAGNLAKPAAKSHITAKALVKEAAAKRPILAEDPAPRPRVTSNPIYRHPKDPNDPGDDFTAFVFHTRPISQQP